MILAIILVIIGAILLMICAALWIEEVMPSPIAAIWAAMALLVMIVGFADIRGTFTDQHKKAYRDITAFGWKIKSSDIHIKDHEVNVAPCMRLRFKKLAGKYVVVGNRPSSEGGGYIILDPTNQPKLIAACKAVGS